MGASGKILVFLPNWVGDVVMSTPALRALREHFASVEITYIGRQVALDTLGDCPWRDRAIVDVSRQRPRLESFLRLVGALRPERYDLAVLLPNSFRCAALARLCSARRIAGYDRDGRGCLLTDKLSPVRGPDGRFVPVSTIDYYIALVRMLGVRCDSRRMELFVSDSDKTRAEEVLSAGGFDAGRPLIMLNPGASFGPSKMWEPASFAAVADELIDRRAVQVIVNAAPNERAIAAQVTGAMRHRPLVSFANQANTLGLLKALLERCELLITNDTGPRHIAAALGAAVVTVFGSTDPAWARIDCSRERIVRLDVQCSPCQSKMCLQPAGPLYHQCMSGIMPAQVVASALELLGCSAEAKA